MFLTVFWRFPSFFQNFGQFLLLSPFCCFLVNFPTLFCNFKTPINFFSCFCLISAFCHVWLFRCAGHWHGFGLQGEQTGGYWYTPPQMWWLQLVSLIFWESMKTHFYWILGLLHCGKNNAPKNVFWKSQKWAIDFFWPPWFSKNFGCASNSCHMVHARCEMRSVECHLVPHFWNIVKIYWFWPFGWSG